MDDEAEARAYLATVASGHPAQTPQHEDPVWFEQAPLIDPMITLAQWMGRRPGARPVALDVSLGDVRRAYGLNADPE